MSKTFNVNPAVYPKMLRFIQVAGCLTKRALDDRERLQKEAEKAASLRQPLIDLMLKTDTIGEHQKKQAEDMLGSHEQTLNLLKSAIDKITELKQQMAQKNASDLGGPADDPNKAAGDRDPSWSLTDPFPGRRTSEKKASDMAMLSVLDSPV